MNPDVNTIMGAGILLALLFMLVWGGVKRYKSRRHEEQLPPEPAEEEEETDTLYCEDCKYCRPDNKPSYRQRCRLQFAKCVRNAEKYGGSVISPKYLFSSDAHYCTTEREFDHLCGVEGKYFEPKSKVKIQRFTLHELLIVVSILSAISLIMLAGAVYILWRVFGG